MRERTVHIVLGAVSGTGKSFVARLIAESVAIEFGLPLCFSLTAGNRPGMECAAKLKARRVDLAYVVSTGRAVCLDPMIETVVERGRSVVIDSCARLCPALFDCLRYDAVVLGLRDSGFAVQFHLVMTGGENLTASLKELRQSRHLLGGEHAVTVWLNPMVSPVTWKGVPLFACDWFGEMAAPFESWVSLPCDSSVSGQDLMRRFVNSGLTLAEAIDERSAFTRIERTQLRIFRRALFAKIGRTSARIQPDTGKGGETKRTFNEHRIQRKDITTYART